MTGSTEGVPLAFMHNIKHNKVIHERVLFLTVQVAEVPNVPEAERIEVQTLAHEMYRVILHYGFMDNPNVPRALSSSKRFGLTFNIMDTSFFLSRETPIPSAQPGMARWREHVYAWMARSAASAMEFFQIPPGRVVELGAQMEI
jgi:KUP system potassium uptake protein